MKYVIIACDKYVIFINSRSVKLPYVHVSQSFVPTTEKYKHAADLVKLCEIFPKNFSFILFIPNIVLKNIVKPVNINISNTTKNILLFKKNNNIALSIAMQCNAIQYLNNVLHNMQDPFKYLT